jgi:hypothetical protein
LSHYRKEKGKNPYAIKMQAVMHAFVDIRKKSEIIMAFLNIFLCTENEVQNLVICNEFTRENFVQSVTNKIGSIEDR